MSGKNENGVILAFSLLILGILLIFFPYDILHGLKIGKFVVKIEDYDKLGDFINGVTTPLLSISAFILLYMTYRSQSEELEQTREVMKNQSLILDKQQFETTFFNLLNLHHQIVNNIDLRSHNYFSSLTKVVRSSNETTKSGRDCFVSFYWGFKNMYNAVRKKHTDMDELNLIISAYSQYYKRHQSDLGHYFRNLYHIVKFVDQSSIKNKSDYTSLIRAQLSSHELLMLFYNCLTTYGSKFKPLIEDYHLLKNMPIEDLLNENHKSLYSKSAFQKLNK